VPTITRRSWRALLAAALTAMSPTAVGAVKPDPSLEAYGHPQQLVDIGGRRLNLFCLGHGSPTVILVGGLGTSTFTWRKVHAELARTTRVCAYDRAGYGFSDPGPPPRDTAHLAADLAALTKAARLRPPYVLVGASLGGMIVRLYADTHLQEVGGMVLVDPETEHEEDRLDRVSPGFRDKLNKGGDPFRKCAVALETRDSKAAADCIDSPDPDYPPAVNAHFTKVSSNPAFWRESLSEYEEALGRGADEVRASKRSYGSLPLIVLTSTTPDSIDPKHPDPYFDARTKVVMAMHDETAHLSSRGVNRAIPGATHQIMISVPQAVVDAVNEVVADVRHDQAAGQPLH
jgi:pimeloyl-ACP methyl ester carboxylesterase